MSGLVQFHEIGYSRAREDEGLGAAPELGHLMHALRYGEHRHSTCGEEEPDQ